MSVKGNKIYFGALDYDSVLFGLPAPHISVYLPPPLRKYTGQNIFKQFFKKRIIKNYKDIIINLVSTGRGKFILLIKCFHIEKIQFSERDRASKVKFATCILVYPQLHNNPSICAEVM